MKITSKTMKDILLAVSGALEPKDMGKIIFPLIDAIETLQSCLEIVSEERKEYEKEAKGLKEIIEQSQKNSEQIGIIKQINEDYREGQNEITTLRGENERIETQWVQIQKENERKDNIIKSMEKNSTDLLKSNEELRETIKKVEDTNAILHVRIMTKESENKTFKEQISKLEDTNRKLSGELLNQTEEIHLLEEEVDRLKSENEDMKEGILKTNTELRQENLELLAKINDQKWEINRLVNNNEDLKRLNRQIQENEK